MKQSKKRRKNSRLQFERVVEVLREAERQVEEFSEYLFTTLEDKVVVMGFPLMGFDEVKVRFKDGREVTL